MNDQVKKFRAMRSDEWCLLQNNDKPYGYRSATGQGFTLTEMLVTIAVIVLVAAIAFSGGRSAINSARSAEAMSNLKQTGALVATYTADNNNLLPHSAVWSKIFGGSLVFFSRSLAEATVPDFFYAKAPYTNERPLPEIFYDPCLKGDTRKQHSMGAFGVNRSIIRDAWFDNEPKTSLLNIPRASQKVIFCSVASKGASNSGGWLLTGEDFATMGMSVDTYPDPRNGGKAAALFADGHVENLDVKNMDQVQRRRYFILDP